MNALERNGSPKPEFETDDARSYFISRFFIHEGFLQEPNERSLSEVLSEVLKQSDFDKVKKIILYIEENGKITPKEAEENCGKSSATVRRYLKMLAQTGYIEAEGSTNNTVYKMTDKKRNKLF